MMVSFQWGKEEGVWVWVSWHWRESGEVWEAVSSRIVSARLKLPAITPQDGKRSPMYACNHRQCLCSNFSVTRQAEGVLH